MAIDPDKPLEAVAWMYDRDGVREWYDDRLTSLAPVGWLETPLTDLNRAHEIIARLEAENTRLRGHLAAKPWPPSDADLREMLAYIVGVWWSQGTANFIRSAKHLKPEDIKGMYAIRDVLAPYIARAALKEE